MNPSAIMNPEPVPAIWNAPAYAMKPSLVIPLIGNRLASGTWRRLVFLDFDNRDRYRIFLGMIVRLDVANRWRYAINS